MTRPTLPTKLREVLKDVQPSGDGWMARCPAHEDRHPSLSITVKNGRTLFYCHAGCTWKEIRRALKKLGVKKRELVVSSDGHADDSGSPGCTLTKYAKTKGLLKKFLRKLGLKTVKYLGEPAILIPYVDESGKIVAHRYRRALAKSGDVDKRFQWRKGDKPLPYGLSRLDLARKAGCIVLVEGESDGQTLWSHGIPAIAIPGATSWREEWTDFFEGIPKIFVVIEPDTGGEAVLKWLSTSKIRDRVQLVTLRRFKDVSAMHVANPEKFRTRWKRARRRAVPFNEHAKLIAESRRRELWKTCKGLALEPRILDVFAKDLATIGFAGSKKTPKRLYVIFNTRFLSRPVSAVIKGPSSAGKSYAIQTVLLFFPEGAYYSVSGMSERALIYSEESLKYRFIVIYEAAGINTDFLRYLIHSLLTEGIVRYVTVEKVGGRLQSRTIEREGPTGVLTSTTAWKLHHETETRLFSIPAQDSRKQTRAIMAKQAEAAQHGDVDAAQAVGLDRWHAYQEWLTLGEHRVVIPYARSLVKLIPPVALKLNRDVPAILSAIKAHAIMHQATRRRDQKGRIIAKLDDYRAVRDLFADLVSEGIDATVSQETRETVRAVRKLKGLGKESRYASVLSDHVTDLPNVADLVPLLKRDKSTVFRRVRVAQDKGYLVNMATQRHQYRLDIGESLPEDREILPSLKKLTEAYRRAKKKEGAREQDQESTT